MDFANADYDKIKNEINSTDWCWIFGSKTTLQSKVKKFYSIVDNTIENNVKKKKIKKSIVSILDFALCYPISATTFLYYFSSNNSHNHYLKSIQFNLNNFTLFSV